MKPYRVAGPRLAACSTQEDQRGATSHIDPARSCRDQRNRDIGHGAAADGEWVFVSGTTGFDYQTMTISDDVVKQAEQCMLNIERALTDAGSVVSDVVRVCQHPSGESRFCLMLAGAPFSVLKRFIHAATMIEAGLSDPR